jgi:hypothetical protein
MMTLKDKFSKKDQKTLQEVYTQKRIQNLKNSLKVIDNKLINEIYDIDARLIIEAFDPKQMDNAIKIMGQLNKVDFSKLPQLDDAKKAALEDIEKVLGGDGKSKIRLIANFAKKIVGGDPIEDNPLITSLAFVEDIKNFFDLLTKFFEKLPGSKDARNLASIITGGTEEEDEIDVIDVEKLRQNLKSGKYSNQEQKNALKKLEDYEKIITRGLSVDTPLSKMGRNWIKNYLGGKQGMITLANQIMGMKLDDLKNLNQTIASSFKDVEAAGQGALNAAKSAKSGELPNADKSKEERAPSRQQQQQNVRATQQAAKAAGITEEETVDRFLKLMGINDAASDDAAVAIQTLKSFAQTKKVADGQLDGFVDGITVDQKEVRQKITNGVKELQKKKQEEANKKAASAAPAA